METFLTITFCAIIIALIAFIEVRLQDQTCPRKKDDSSNDEADYIEVGGLKWARTNLGSREDSPFGDHLTCEYAWAQEHGEWRLPTVEQIESFRNNTEYFFNNETNHGYFIDREKGTAIALPAIGWKTTIDGRATFYGEYGYLRTASLDKNGRSIALQYGEKGTHFTPMSWLLRIPARLVLNE